MVRSPDVDYVQSLTIRITEAGTLLDTAEREQDDAAVRRCRAELQALCAVDRRCGVYAVIGPRGGSLAMTG